MESYEMKFIKDLLKRWFGKQQEEDSDDDECVCGLEKKIVFRKDNISIIPDRDGYNGAFWKKYNRFGIRIGTWNKDLTKLIGK